MNLPAVLYAYETWSLSLTLRKEHRLRVSENRVLRRIFGPKREEVAGGWRIMHNTSIIRVIKSRKMNWTGIVARMGENEKCPHTFYQKT
jgi:hypothetical protein